jgi:hypothetical protein
LLVERGQLAEGVARSKLAPLKRPQLWSQLECLLLGMNVLRVGMCVLLGHRGLLVQKGD